MQQIQSSFVVCVNVPLATDESWIVLTESQLLQC
jgi:hypothetical protein